MSAERFGLHDGQFFGHYRYKNLQWFSDGTYIGYGDLRNEDIDRIQQNLHDGEVFEGFNEHHGTEWQQTSTPMVRITTDRVMHRAEIQEKEGR